ncbi:MAG: DNA repair protein RadC, partial [Gammaproteobacteria bacterium]
MTRTKASFTIKDWSQNDRPREKLLDKGRSALTDAELVAILIASGSRKESAVDLSRRILASVDNNLSELGKLSVEDLQQFNGIGMAKGVTIVAALELGRRRRDGVALSRKRISSSKSVFDLLQPILGDLPHEEFWILYLNNSNKVLQKQQLSKGGI